MKCQWWWRHLLFLIGFLGVSFPSLPLTITSSGWNWMFFRAIVNIHIRTNVFCIYAFSLVYICNEYILLPVEWPFLRTFIEIFIDKQIHVSLFPLNYILSSNNFFNLNIQWKLFSWVNEAHNRTYNAFMCTPRSRVYFVINLKNLFIK